MTRKFILVALVAALAETHARAAPNYDVLHHAQRTKRDTTGRDFDLIDANGDGAITAHELAALTSMRGQPTPRQMRVYQGMYVSQINSLMLFLILSGSTRIKLP